MLKVLANSGTQVASLHQRKPRLHANISVSPPNGRRHELNRYTCVIKLLVLAEESQKSYLSCTWRERECPDLRRIAEAIFHPLAKKQVYEYRYKVIHYP